MNHSNRRSHHKQRVFRDFYPTPSLLTKVLLDNYLIKGEVLEPCAGNGDMAAVLEKSPFIETVISTDVKDGKRFDATSPEYWQQNGRVSWVVTNPPFKCATEILSLALKNSNVGVAFLLRLTYLEPCLKRARLLQEYSDNLVKIIPVSPRPKFREGNKTDSTTVAWFVWDKSFSWQKSYIDCPFNFVSDWRK